MTENDLDKIRLKKAEMLLKAQSMPTEIVKIHSAEEFNQLKADFPDRILIIDEEKSRETLMPLLSNN